MRLSSSIRAAESPTRAPKYLIMPSFSRPVNWYELPLAELPTIVAPTSLARRALYAKALLIADALYKALTRTVREYLKALGSKPLPAKRKAAKR
jgi:hypothetical protein